MLRNQLIKLFTFSVITFAPLIANANICLENTNTFGFSFIGQYGGHVTAELNPGMSTFIPYKKGMVISFFRVELGSWIYVTDFNPQTDNIHYQFFSILGKTYWNEIYNAC